MKLLGIDYGSKRIGIATSDSSGVMAFPKMVLNNDRSLISNIKKICSDEKIEKIVIGDSKDSNMKDNQIMQSIRRFADVISNETKLPIEFQLEFMTSQQAILIQGENDMIDASAATIILQSFIDKSN
ncbi:MAG: Holliday junction resolvase RuvX [Candidatus Paceibacterota bacterium]